MGLTSTSAGRRWPGCLLQLTSFPAADGLLFCSILTTKQSIQCPAISSQKGRPLCIRLLFEYSVPHLGFQMPAPRKFYATSSPVATGELYRRGHKEYLTLRARIYHGLCVFLLFTANTSLICNTTEGRKTDSVFTWVLISNTLLRNNGHLARLVGEEGRKGRREGNQQLFWVTDFLSKLVASHCGSVAFGVWKWSWCLF